MSTIRTIQRKNGEVSYLVQITTPEGRRSTRTFRDRAEAEALADQHGGWGRGVTGPIPRPIEERLWERVDVGPDDQCWEWQGPVNKPGGYGYLSSGGRGGVKVYAHRAAYEVSHGPIPKGLVVRHACDNPPCCNPAHLQVGTHQDNTDDMLARGRHYLSRRTHCANGHEFTTENTRLSEGRNGNVRRVCRACERSRSGRHGGAR